MLRLFSACADLCAGPPSEAALEDILEAQGKLAVQDVLEDPLIIHPGDVLDPAEAP